MNKRSRWLIFLFLLLFPFSAAPAAQQDLWLGKVDAWILESAASEGETEFLIFLNEQADLSGASRLKTKEEKGAYVFSQLVETARRTQAPVLEELRRQGVDYRPYWIANLIWVRGDEQVVRTLARRPDVARLHANPAVRHAEPRVSANPPESAADVEWNIDLVGAPQVWAQGFAGQGVVIGGQDTGYDWEHPALKAKYRGWDGASADHNYNWHDAIHTDDPHSSGANDCGFDSPEPCDDNGHGTHTMGTMVGSEGANQIGMAPEARWIGCRNMENGWGKPSTYLECYQWFLAPTDLNGENPDPSLAPHVINNSWSCPVQEGCTEPNILLSAVEAVRAAGILTVHSAGNNGYFACSSIAEPAAIYDASFSVGATDQNDHIAGFSSRGPVLVDGSGRIKPDIVAPGVGIRSSLRNNTYGSLQGTSMAGPHVAGLAALLISVKPDLAGQVDAIEEAITSSAVPLETTDCGGMKGEIPNNVYGWGRIDAWAAFQLIRPDYALSLSRDQEKPALPGWSVRYSLTLTNAGSKEDTYTLLAVSSQGWAVSAPDSLTLQSGETQTFTVAVSAPPESQMGAVDTTTLTVVSSGDPQISAQVRLTTTLAYLRFFPSIEK